MVHRKVSTLVRWCLALIVLVSATAFAEDRLIEVNSRPDVTISYWWMQRDHAVATVLLFSGGSGGIGYRGGMPQSGNFLIRARDAFAATPLNVALVGNPSDSRAISPAFRQSSEHLADVRSIIDDIRKQSTAPIWLVGTSQGTISAAANGLALGSEVAGVVLSSTLTGQQPGGSVTGLPLETLVVPVLVYQHKQDSCRITTPAMAQALVSRLTQSPNKKYVEVEGGGGATGSPCEAFHYHGFIGMEEQAVRQITDWMLHPVP
jgi:pimeloyl-ACP methyl ester carboxylesterase